MGARPCSPLLGRFLSVDPVEGGSTNDCDYVTANPINTSALNGDRAYRRYHRVSGHRYLRVRYARQVTTRARARRSVGRRSRAFIPISRHRTPNVMFDDSGRTIPGQVSRGQHVSARRVRVRAIAVNTWFWFHTARRALWLNEPAIRCGLAGGGYFLRSARSRPHPGSTSSMDLLSVISGFARYELLVLIENTFLRHVAS
jgi:hypothetical protein